MAKDVTSAAGTTATADAASVRAQDAAADAAAAKAGFIEAPGSPAPGATTQPPAKGTPTGTASEQAPPGVKPDKAGASDASSAEQFKPTRKQIDAARELGLTNEQIDGLTKDQAEAYERARSLSSKAQGKLARELATLREQVSKLSAQPAGAQTETQNGGDTAFVPPGDQMLADLFGSKDSKEAKQYVAALQKAHKVDALEARLNELESGVDGERTRQQQKAIDGVFDGADVEYYPGLGKTDNLDDDEDELRTKICGYAQGLTDAGMEPAEATQHALNIIFPDALARQAEARLLKQIEARARQAIGTPSGTMVGTGGKPLTDAERDQAADAEARKRGLI